MVHIESENMLIPRRHLVLMDSKFLHIIHKEDESFYHCGFAGIVSTDKDGDVAEFEFGKVSEPSEVFKAD